MDPLSAVLAFSLAAALLTLTPGLDTALVLRTAAVEGPGQAMLAGAGVSTGVLAWGLMAALGLGAVLAVSETAYLLLRIAGAAYLLWLGIGMLRAALSPERARHLAAMASAKGAGGTGGGRGRGWYWRGLLTNLLNPKVGVFYVSFLPQFTAEGVPVVAFSVGLAAIHATMGIAWFALLTLATRPITGLLKRPAVTRSLDGLTGAVLIGFGLRLALERRS